MFSLRSRASTGVAVFTVLALAVMLTLSNMAPATASTSSKEKTWDYAYAVYPSDGDTVWVCLEGDKKCTPKDSKTWSAIRLMSVQAMEVKHSTGISKEAKAAGVPSMTVDQCHGDEATAALNTLVFGKSTVSKAAKSPHKLRLRSMKESSSSYGRDRRSVEVYRGGKWVDVQAELLKAGHVLWMPLPSSLGEYAHNAEYNTLAQTAAKNGKNLWDKDYCKSGPSQSASLAVDVKWDANGNDLTNINGEYSRVRNMGKTTVDVSGWSLRTASWQVFDFPKGTKIAPGGWVMVHSGKAPKNAKARHYYVGSATPFHMNISSKTGTGGGAYLFDKDGDLRAWEMYGCKVGCAKNPGLDITKVKADAAGDDFKNVNGEYITLKNTSKKTVNLAPFMIKEGGVQFAFSPGSYLKAGESVKIKVGKGSNTHKTKYMQRSSPILGNGGGKVQLVTYQGNVLDCRSWGKTSC